MKRSHPLSHGTKGYNDPNARANFMEFGSPWANMLPSRETELVSPTISPVEMPAHQVVCEGEVKIAFENITCFKMAHRIPSTTMAMLNQDWLNHQHRDAIMRLALQLYDAGYVKIEAQPNGIGWRFEYSLVAIKQEAIK